MWLFPDLYFEWCKKPYFPIELNIRCNSLRGVFAFRSSFMVTGSSLSQVKLVHVSWNGRTKPGMINFRRFKQCSSVHRPLICRNSRAVFAFGVVRSAKSVRHSFWLVFRLNDTLRIGITQFVNCNFTAGVSPDSVDTKREEQLSVNNPGCFQDQ